MVMVSLKWIEFFGETDPIAYFSETRQDMDQKIDLQKLNFSFAVDNLDARIGTVEVTQISWNGLDGKKIYTPVNLVSCDTLQPFHIPLSN